MPAELPRPRPGGRAARYRITLGLRARLGVREPPPVPLLSPDHDKLAAAVWRFPFRAIRGGYVSRPVGVGKQRQVVRMLALGATVRQTERRLRIHHRTIMKIRQQVLAWQDPDDQED